MLDFKPDHHLGIPDSSDDPGDVEHGGLTASDSDASDDLDEDTENEYPDIGEEPGNPSTQENPFYKDSDSDGDTGMSDSDEDSDDDKPKAADVDDEEDDLIKALKAARQKQARNSPPDLKTSEMVTDISFHPEADIIALGNISGDLSLFSYSNEENSLIKKLKLSQKSLRGLEFDESGTSLLTISKDKTFRILDTETWTVR